MEKSIKMEGERFEFIDVLRGVAIISVFFYHVFWDHFSQIPDRFVDGFLAFSTYSLEFWVLYPFSFGWLGVPLFFILSGYSIYYSYLRMCNFKSPYLTFDLLKIFYLRRFFRILPAYFVCLLAAWILTKKEPFHLIYHALLIHNFNRETFFSINPSFWSIAHEWQYYLIFPVFIILIYSFRGLKNLCLLALAVSLGGTIYLNSIQVNFHDKFLYFNVGFLWYQWLAGAYLADQQFLNRKILKFPKWLLISLPIAYLFGTWCERTYVFSSYLAVTCVFLLMNQMTLIKSQFDSTIFKALKFIGTISFSFYLLHQPILRFFFIFWNKYVLDGLFGLIIGIPIVFGLVTLLSFLLYQFVERPSQEFCKRYIQNNLT